MAAGVTAEEMNICIEEGKVDASVCAVDPLADGFDVAALSGPARTAMVAAGTLPDADATATTTSIRVGDLTFLLHPDGSVTDLESNVFTFEELKKALGPEFGRQVAEVNGLIEGNNELAGILTAATPDELANAVLRGEQPSKLLTDKLTRLKLAAGIDLPSIGPGGSGGGASGPTETEKRKLLEFEFDKAQQEFINQLTLRGMDFDEARLTANDAFSKFESKRDFIEAVRQFDANFGAGERSRLGNLGLGLAAEGRLRQQVEMQILRDPADFLSRAFNQFGVDSPFGEVTQADLLNRLRDEFANVDAFVSEQEALTQSRLGSPSPGPGGTPTPTGSTKLTTPSGGTATGRLADGSGTVNLDPNQLFGTGNLDVRGQGFDSATAAPGETAEGDRLAAFQAAFDLAKETNAPPAILEQRENQLLEVQEEERLAAETRNLAGAKHGGFISDKEFLVGDQKKGAEETILNPTGAPLAVVPTPGRKAGRLLRGFAHGTAHLGEDLVEPVEATAPIGNIAQAILDTEGQIDAGGDTTQLQAHLDNLNAMGSSGVFTNADGFLVNADTGQVLQTREQAGLGPTDPGGKLFGASAPTGGSGTSLDGSFSRLASSVGLLPEGRVTQAQLQQNAINTAPPGVLSVAEGNLAQGPEGQFRDVTNALPPRFSRIFTPQQFASLTPDEQTAMRIFLASFNVSLDDYLFAVGKRFQSTRTRSRGRLNSLR